MGKAGKLKKKRRLEAQALEEAADSDEEQSEEGDSSAQAIDEDAVRAAAKVLEALADGLGGKEHKQLRTMLWPLVEIQIKSNAHFEASARAPEIQKPSEEDLQLLRRVISHFASTAEGRASFVLSSSRPFRRALHPIVVEQIRKNSGGGVEDVSSYSARISNSYRAKDWALTLKLLHEMSSSGEVLKLGAIQRWVRDADRPLAEDGDKNSSLLLLDACMRVAESNAIAAPKGRGQVPLDLFKAVPSINDAAVVHRSEPFCPPPLPMQGETEDEEEKEKEKEKVIPIEFRVVHSTPGAERKPPSPHALNVYSTAPGTIYFNSSTARDLGRRRLDVPGVPGAFLMTGVLSRRECLRIIQVADAIEYKPDAVDGIDNIVWLADDSFLKPLYARCEKMLPASIGQGKLRGLNARFRLFRYLPGAVYRPHIDGAWPGSGLDQNGVYTDDVFADTEEKLYSKLTFLVYLNDSLGGGETTFFLPSKDKGFPHIEARSVSPRVGNVLCFPHGDVLGSLVHEGSEVAPGGVKYIIRTDVLYTI